MTRSGSKKTRLNSLTARKLNEKICDVKLSEFADSTIPGGKGRLRKSKNVLSQVRQISTSEDIDVGAVEDNDEEVNLLKVNKTETEAVGLTENSNQYTEYPLKIWLLIAEYIRPEDVRCFSLICRNTLSIVNMPFFWIRLYKRYYRKIEFPKCLSSQCLEIRRCLKQKVVRSLYYFYTPYTLSVINNNPLTNEMLVGRICIHHGIKSIEEKESNEGKKWLYTFKLRASNENDSWMQKRSHFQYLNDINYNPDDGCRLLKVICKEFVVIPSVMGMRLRKVDCSTKTTTLKFSSAPLSKVNSELGTVTLYLDHIQKPSVIPWWHPDYWDHTKCCIKKKSGLSVSC